MFASIALTLPSCVSLFDHLNSKVREIPYYLITEATDEPSYMVIATNWTFSWAEKRWRHWTHLITSIRSIEHSLTLVLWLGLNSEVSVLIGGYYINRQGLICNEHKAINLLNLLNLLNLINLLNLLNLWSYVPLKIVKRLKTLPIFLVRDLSIYWRWNHKMA